MTKTSAVQKSGRSLPQTLLLILTMAALALGASCSGCGQETPEQIAERVRGALSEAGYSGISVAMRDGQPVLSGTVDSEGAKASIGSLVAGLGGITGVTNNIRVEVPVPEPTEEERAAAERARACAAGMTAATADNVYFATSSATLSRDARATLDGIVTASGACDAVSLRLAGHADPRGDEGYNQGLSDRRVQSVERYLEGKGIAGDAISGSGFGETRSLGGSLDDDRRVEISTGG